MENKISKDYDMLTWDLVRTPEYYHNPRTPDYSGEN